MTNGYNRGIGNVYSDNDAQPIGVGLDVLHRSLREFSEPITTRLDTLIGVFERHEPKRYISQPFKVSPTANITTFPVQILDTTVGFDAWSFIISNLSGYVLFEATTQSYIPPNQLNFVVSGTFATAHIQLWVIGGSDTLVHDVSVIATEERLDRTSGDIDTSSGGGSATDVTVHDPTTTSQKLAVDASGRIGINNFPATQAVSGTIGVNNFPASQVVDGRGSANMNPSQTALNSATATVIVAARATRQSVVIRNIDATNNVYLGLSGVSTSNGFLLKPGESIVLQNQIAIYGISSAGTPAVCAIEEYS